MSETTIYKSPEGEAELLGLYDSVLSSLGIEYQERMVGTRFGGTHTCYCRRKRCHVSRIKGHRPCRGNFPKPGSSGMPWWLLSLSLEKGYRVYQQSNPPVPGGNKE